MEESWAMQRHTAIGEKIARFPPFALIGLHHLQTPAFIAPCGERQDATSGVETGQHDADFIDVRRFALPPYDIVPCFILVEQVFVLIAGLVPDIIGSSRQVAINNVADIPHKRRSIVRQLQSEMLVRCVRGYAPEFLNRVSSLGDIGIIRNVVDETAR